MRFSLISLEVRVGHLLKKPTSFGWVSNISFISLYSSGKKIQGLEQGLKATLFSDSADCLHPNFCVIKKLLSKKSQSD